jgi:hypothetical protein
VATPAQPPLPLPPQPSIPQAEAKAFVDRYLAAQNSGDLATLLSLYSDEVDYFTMGLVSKAFISKDKDSYYRRWSQVRNTLSSDLTIRSGADSNEMIVSFSIEFLVSNSLRGASIHGTATDILTIRRINDRLTIVAEKQIVRRT